MGAQLTAQSDQIGTFVGNVQFLDTKKAITLNEYENGWGLNFDSSNMQNEIKLKKGMGAFSFGEFYKDLNKIAWTIEPNTEDEYSLLLDVNGQLSITTLHKVDTSFQSKDMESYVGGFRDIKGRNHLVYTSHGRLLFSSAYSKETNSLTKLMNGSFWTRSGEKLEFKNENEGHFSSVRIWPSDSKFYDCNYFNPYRIEEYMIPVQGDSLYAKVYFPITDQSVPGCLVLQGGGAAGIANYEYEAKHFAANGVAAMVFNKSGEGKSRGPGNFQLQSFEEKTIQYLAVFDFFKKLKGIDPKRIGVHGPSEGGRLALMMGIDRPTDVRFVIAASAPIMSMREGQLYAINQHNRQAGWSEDDNLKSLSIWNEYYDGIIRDSISPILAIQIESLLYRHENAFLPPTNTAIPASPRADDLLNRRVMTQLSCITHPVLLQYGDSDRRVHADKSVENFIEYAPFNADIKFYEHADHSFLTPQYRIVSGYMYDKIEWLKKQKILKN